MFKPNGMKILILTAIFITILTGCLKDKSDYNYEGIKPGIIIPNSNWPAGFMPVQDTMFIGPQPLTSTIHLYARVSWSGYLDKPVKVVFKKDPGMVNNYNTRWSSPWSPPYEPLPDSCFQAVNLGLTIPAGERQAYIPVTIYPNKIQNGIPYILAFTIETADGIMILSNFKTMLFAMKRF
jgi:hypothetical protein